MSGTARARSPGRESLLPAAGLAAVALASWLVMFAHASMMAMPGADVAPSLGEGVGFTAHWGVMMAAMMLPSAAPTILLYRTVTRRLSAEGERAVPVALFATVYLLVWTATGVPVYVAHLAVLRARAEWPWVEAALPYAIAAVLALAGAYQLTSLKRACLRHCESPLGFLMRRWRSGYRATLRLAGLHAAYCVGCCWGLMAILVAAGAMSLPWVVAITLVVLAEKVLPHGGRTARVVGVALVALAVAVAVRPSLAGAIDGMR